MIGQYCRCVRTKTKSKLSILTPSNLVLVTSSTDISSIDKVSTLSSAKVGDAQHEAESSAYITTSALLMTHGKLFRKTENKSGPKHLPCGMPQDNFLVSEKLPLKDTNEVTLYQARAEGELGN